MPRERTPSLTTSVQRYVGGLKLNGGPQQVLGALAVELAESLAETPPYARARVATELRACVLALKEVEAEKSMEEVQEEWLRERESRLRR
jgi:hypothetical protein